MPIILDMILNKFCKMPTLEETEQSVQGNSVLLRIPLSTRVMFQDCQWMPKTTDSTKLYLIPVFYYTYMPMKNLHFSLKVSTLWFLFGTAKLLASLSLHLGPLLSEISIN